MKPEENILHLKLFTLWNEKIFIRKNSATSMPILCTLRMQKMHIFDVS